MKLKGRFDDVDAIKMEETRELNSLSRADFQRCFPEVAGTLGQQHITSRRLLEGES
jgi:hypothetical protein